MLLWWKLWSPFFFSPFWSPFASSWKKQVGLQVALYKTKIHLDKTKFWLGRGNWSHACMIYLPKVDSNPYPFPSQLNIMWGCLHPLGSEFVSQSLFLPLPQHHEFINNLHTHTHTHNNMLSMNVLRVFWV